MAILFATAGTSLFSLSGFNVWLILSIAGIGIFYSLGELYRKQLLKIKNQGISVDTNWYVLAVLLAGIGIFLFGGYEGHLLQPHLPDLTLAVYAFVSIIIGLVVSYLILRKVKNKDLSM
jgi:hypothetical protein